MAPEPSIGVPLSVDASVTSLHALLARHPRLERSGVKVAFLDSLAGAAGREGVYSSSPELPPA